MPNFRLSRRKLLAGAAPILAAPAVARLTAVRDAAALDEHAHHSMASHAAMIGDTALASGEPGDLDALLYPPRSLRIGRDVCASTRSLRTIRRSRLPPASSSRPGRTTGRFRAR